MRSRGPRRAERKRANQWNAGVQETEWAGRIGRFYPHHLARVSPSERRITQMRRFFPTCHRKIGNKKELSKPTGPLRWARRIEKQPKFGRPFAPSVPLRLGRYRAQDSVPPKGQTNEETDEDVS